MNQTDQQGSQQDLFSFLPDSGAMGNLVGSMDWAKTPLESERHFRAMFDALPAAIYVTDAEGRLVYFNPAAVEFSGRVPELGVDAWCVTWKLYYLDGTPMPHDACPMAIALQEGRVVRGIEAIAERPDGTRIWFEPYPTPLRDGAGRITGGINMLIDITERKRAEARIRRTEQEFADFFENATVGLHWVAPDGIILRANRAELNLLGYAADEYIGHHIAEFHADPAVIEDILRRLRAGEELHDYEARMRCKDGTLRDVLINSNVLWENGQFIHTRCFTRDITERKQAEQARATLAAIVQSSGDAIVSKTLEGVITSWNATAERMFGYTAAEAVGQSIRMIIPPERQHEEQEILAKLRRGEPIQHYDTVRVTRDGRRIDISLNISPVRDASGRIIGASKIARDITERKRTEAALRASEERFRLMANTAPALIWTADPTGAVTFHNQRWLDYTGITPEQNVHNWPALVHPDDLERCLRAWTQAIEQGTEYEMELRYRRRDGAYRWFVTRATPRYGADGRVVEWFGSTTDIHDRKQAEQALRDLNARLEQRVAERTAELERSNRELDQFAYVASHDLKAPLRAISLLSEWIREDADAVLPAASREHLDKLHQRVQRMDTLLSDLLAYSRAGRQRHAPEPVDSAEVVKQSVELLGLPASFTVTVHDPMPVLETEQVALEMVLRNLIGNAFKHHQQPERGHVWVAAQEQAGWVEFCVRDDGPGIEERFHDRIFGVFQTLKPRDQVEGSGIGLALVKRLVEMRGGTIAVESSPGRGATFRFTWPKFTPSQTSHP